MSEKKPFHSRKSYQPGLVFQPDSPSASSGAASINWSLRSARPWVRRREQSRLRTSTMCIKTPEVLDNGGIIARRVIEMGARDEDIGAMLARALICRQHDKMGDGSATAAVLLQAIYRGGLHYLAAGGNACACAIISSAPSRMRSQVWMK